MTKRYLATAGTGNNSSSLGDTIIHANDLEEACQEAGDWLADGDFFAKGEDPQPEQIDDIDDSDGVTLRVGELIEGSDTETNEETEVYDTFMLHRDGGWSWGGYVGAVEVDVSELRRRYSYELNEWYLRTGTIPETLRLAIIDAVEEL